MLQAQTKICPACRSPLAPTRHTWLSRCVACDFLASNLTPEINARADVLDEARREGALSGLRSANFEAVLDALAAAGLPRDASVLDVGCAHGWLLEKAAARGYRAVGIEPDRAMAEIARGAGLDIRVGFFPDALGSDETFDAVVFNDVLEHVPDIGGVVAASAAALAPGGLLAVNLPLSTGAIYRMADMMDRLGLHGPFDRMWQKDFPSPHISYVTQDNLALIAERAGLAEVARTRLQSVAMDGLWQRLTYDRSMPKPAAALAYAAVGAFSPLLPLLPADIGLQVFAGPAGA